MPSDVSNTLQPPQSSTTNQSTAQQHLQELPVTLINADAPYQKCAKFGFDAELKFRGTLCAGASSHGVACQINFRIAQKVVVATDVTLDEFHNSVSFHTVYGFWSGNLFVSVENWPTDRCLQVAWRGEGVLPTEKPMQINWHKHLFCLG